MFEKGRVMIPEEQFKTIQNLNNYYYHNDKTIIYHGDNRIELKKMPHESIDLIVTDPNYGIKFMGKKWDVDVPAVETWIECLRVLKPGAFAYVMSSPRQDVLSEMIVRIRLAGFDTNFSSIYHVYAQGFPKAMSISKAIMKKVGDRGVVVGKELIDVGIQKGSMHSGRQSKIEERDTLEPTDEWAIKFKGAFAGHQMKPALEVIIVAMKPLSERTFVEQALFNAKGISWLDDCRVPYQSEQDYEQLVNNYKGGLERATPETKDTWKLHDGGWKLGEGIELPNESKGRFPANLLVSDDALNDGCEHKSGDLTGQYGTENKVYGIYDKSRPQYLKGNTVSSFSRYFDLDKWFEENLKKLPKEDQKTFPFLIVPKAAKSERDEFVEDIETEIETGHNRFDTCATCGGTIFQNPDRPSACKCEVPIRQNNKVKGNFHSTVKPIKLMSYLIILGSREGDIVLDPHAGSGTTCIAARMLNRYSIGIDMEESYLRDIAVPKLKEMAKQKSILDFRSE